MKPAALRTPPTNPWSLSRHGRAIDLVDPSRADVDFAEIADTLAHVYRWTGAAHHDVSVAWHTLIGIEVARHRGLEWVVPHWLLHDAHEARIGDIATPVAHALAHAVADHMAAATHHAEMAGYVREGLQLLKHRHDTAIHAAAGLPMPDGQIREAVKQIDLITLMTERRDYLPDSPHDWGDLEHIQPHVRSHGKPPAAAVCAERLLVAFREHLPALTLQATPEPRRRGRAKSSHFC